MTTLSSDPPTFSGITQVTIASPTSVTISWGVNTGVPASQFKVFATPGAAVDYTSAAAVIPVGSLSTTITGLGGQLPYTFAVRACTAQDVCDTNTAVLNVPTINGLMPDAGPPSTLGITGVTKNAGVITVTAPWVPANGLVTFRQVAFYCDSSPTASANPSAYINTQDFYVNNPLTVPTSLTLANMLPFQNMTCHFSVQDFNSPTRSNNSMAVVTFAIGNLTPPATLSGEPAESWAPGTLLR